MADPKDDDDLVESEEDDDDEEEEESTTSPKGGGKDRKMTTSKKPPPINKAKETGFLGKFMAEIVGNIARDKPFSAAMGGGAVAKLLKQSEDLFGSTVVQNALLPALTAAVTDEDAKAIVRGFARTLHIPGAFMPMIEDALEDSIEGLREASRIKDGSDAFITPKTADEKKREVVAKATSKVKTSMDFHDLTLMLSPTDRKDLFDWVAWLEREDSESYKVWVKYYLPLVNSVSKLDDVIEVLTGRRDGEGGGYTKVIPYLHRLYPDAVPPKEEKKMGVIGELSERLHTLVGSAKATTSEFDAKMKAAHEKSEAELLVKHNARRTKYGIAIEYVSADAFEAAKVAKTHSYDSITKYVRAQRI